MALIRSSYQAEATAGLRAAETVAVCMLSDLSGRDKAGCTCFGDGSSLVAQGIVCGP